MLLIIRSLNAEALSIRFGSDLPLLRTAQRLDADNSLRFVVDFKLIRL